MSGSGKRNILVVAGAAIFVFCSQSMGQINILFYGNSYTNGNSGTVPLLVREIAVAAGRPAPNVENAAVDTRDLRFHRLSNTSVIGNPEDFLESPGFQWDKLVLQEFSTKPTNITMSGEIGNVAEFRADALGLLNLVRQHSPGVTPVLFETWARSPVNTAFYQQAYPALAPGGQSSYPAAAAKMQMELRNNYGLARTDLDGIVGAGRSAVGSVGDAFEAGGWSNLYGPDNNHATNGGYLLAAMVLYGTIYYDDVSDINLTALGATQGVSAQEVSRLKGLADLVIVVPEPGGVAVGLLVIAGMVRPRRRR